MMEYADDAKVSGIKYWLNGLTGIYLPVYLLQYNIPPWYL
jgi:hypothetical protein